MKTDEDGLPWDNYTTRISTDGEDQILYIYSGDRNVSFLFDPEGRETVVSAQDHDSPVLGPVVEISLDQMHDALVATRRYLAGEPWTLKGIHDH